MPEGYPLFVNLRGRTMPIDPDHAILYVESDGAVSLAGDNLPLFVRQIGCGGGICYYSKVNLFGFDFGVQTVRGKVYSTWMFSEFAHIYAGEMANTEICRQHYLPTLMPIAEFVENSFNYAVKMEGGPPVLGDPYEELDGVLYRIGLILQGTLLNYNVQPRFEEERDEGHVPRVGSYKLVFDDRSSLWLRPHGVFVETRLVASFDRQQQDGSYVREEKVCVIHEGAQIGRA